MKIKFLYDHRPYGVVVSVLDFRNFEAGFKSQKGMFRPPVFSQLRVMMTAHWELLHKWPSVRNLPG